jgi:hypothetical protein
MRTSIDKVKLFNTNFNLTQVETFGINSHNKQPGEPISELACCILENGTPIIGQNVYAHSRGDVPFHINIKMNQDVPMAWVEFNPNNFFNMAQAMEVIDAELKGVHKLEFDFLGANLSRVDIARDDTMSTIAKAYHEPIKHMAKARYYQDTTQYPDSLLFKTSSRRPPWEISTYDKGKKNQKDEGEKKPISTNDLRTEIRLLKPGYISKHLGFGDFATLLDINGNELQSLYVNTTKKFLKDLNDISKTQPREDVCDVLELMPILMQERFATNVIYRYICSSIGQPSIVLLRHNFIEAYDIWASTQDWASKQSKSNKRAKILNMLDTELRNINAMATKRANKVDESLNSRLKEYQDKFLVA